MAENNAENLLKDFWKHIDNSLECLDTGAPLDMVTLESKARQICDIISALPPENASQYKPQLEELITYLTGVQEKLEAQKSDTIDEVHNLNTMKMAQSAYRGASHLNKKQEA